MTKTNVFALKRALAGFLIACVVLAIFAFFKPLTAMNYAFPFLMALGSFLYGRYVQNKEERIDLNLVLMAITMVFAFGTLGL